MEDYDETRAATDTGDAQQQDGIDGLRCSPCAAVIAFSDRCYAAELLRVDVFFAIAASSWRPPSKRRASTKTFLVEF